MRIGDLSAATGASARSLRYYEHHNLIVSERSPSGQRHYAEDAVERVRLIRLLLRAGLTLRTVDEVLPCVHDPSKRTPWLAARLSEEVARIDDQLECLQQTRRTLAGLAADYRS